MSISHPELRFSTVTFILKKLILFFSRLKQYSFRTLRDIEMLISVINQMKQAATELHLELLAELLPISQGILDFWGLNYLISIYKATDRTYPSCVGAGVGFSGWTVVSIFLTCGVIFPGISGTISVSTGS